MTPIETSWMMTAFVIYTNIIFALILFSNWHGKEIRELKSKVWDLEFKRRKGE